MSVKTKLFASSIFSGLLIFSGLSSVEAAENTSSPKAKVTVINNLTGESKAIPVIDKKISTEISPKSINTLERSTVFKESNVKSFVEEHEVFIPSQELGVNSKVPLRGSVTTYDSKGGVQSAGGITAKLNVAYDMGVEKIRLNKVYGSWSPSHGYYLTNRKVNAHTGQLWGYTFSKAPTTNSFSYTTGFGYNRYAGGGDISPRAWSSAVSRVSGMSATYTIQVEFTFPT